MKLINLFTTASNSYEIQELKANYLRQDQVIDFSRWMRKPLEHSNLRQSLEMLFKVDKQGYLFDGYTDEQFINITKNIDEVIMILTVQITQLKSAGKFDVSLWEPGSYYCKDCWEEFEGEIDDESTCQSPTCEGAGRLVEMTY